MKAPKWIEIFEKCSQGREGSWEIFGGDKYLEKWGGM